MTNPYQPLTSGWVDYAVTEMKGFWHDDTMHIDVLETPPVPSNAFQRITRIPKGGVTAFVFGAGGVPCTAINPPATLYNGEGVDGIGEYVNNADIGMVQVPPILELQKTPVVGRVISGVSEIFEHYNNEWSSFPYPWRNRVIDMGAWGPWRDSIRSGLRELQGGVYNYVHARDIGCVNFWYGTLNADNTVKGYQYYAVANG